MTKCKHCDGTWELEMIDSDHIHKMECDWCDGKGTIPDNKYKERKDLYGK